MVSSLMACCLPSRFRQLHLLCSARCFVEEVLFCSQPAPRLSLAA